MGNQSYMKKMTADTYLFVLSLHRFVSKLTWVTACHVYNKHWLLFIIGKADLIIFHRDSMEPNDLPQISQLVSAKEKIWTKDLWFKIRPSFKILWSQFCRTNFSGLIYPKLVYIEEKIISTKWNKKYDQNDHSNSKIQNAMGWKCCA